MKPKGDITKLPKWAQSEIKRLNNNVESLSARLAAGPEDSDTFADPYAETPRPLGQGTTVEFRLSDGDAWGNRIRVRAKKGALYVLGGDGIAVFPQSSNTLVIKSERF